MNQQEQFDKLADEIRKIYRTSDGPRLLREMMEEFPYPRKVWNDNPDPKRAIKGGWGMDATCTMVKK